MLHALDGVSHAQFHFKLKMFSPTRPLSSNTNYYRLILYLKDFVRFNIITNLRLHPLLSDVRRGMAFSTYYVYTADTPITSRTIATFTENKTITSIEENPSCIRKTTDTFDPVWCLVYQMTINQITINLSKSLLQQKLQHILELP